MISDNNKNLYLAIGLSILVIIGWNYFYAGPQMERSRQQQQAQHETQQAAAGEKPGAPGASPAPSVNAPPQGGVTPTSQAPEAPMTREAALAKSPRVKIDTPALEGSFALRGGRIDDVKLKGYRETVEPNSPIITLLSPPGAPNPFYADAGFVPGAGSTVPVPTADTLWTADGTTLTPQTPVTLTWDNGQGLVFTRKISVDDRYMFTVADSVRNTGTTPQSLHAYALVARTGTPVTSGYAVLHEGFVGVVGDSGVQELTYAGIEKETRGQKTLTGQGGWLGFTDKYWAAVVVPDQSTTDEDTFSVRGTGIKTYQTDALGPAQQIAPGATVSTMTRIFAGAKEKSTLDAYQTNLGIRKFDLLIDWGYFYFITKPMFDLLDFIYRYVGNFGVAILCITVIVKAVFFPLANRSYLSMAKMKAMQPQLQQLKERYPDDKVKQQQEMMAIYKREKINPVAGCLPMLIQVPVFFALYKVIFITIEMRQAPFFGWIHDLSQPDPTNVFNLFGLLPFDPTHLPVFGHFLAIGIWPIIMGLSMFFQMKMNPTPPDPMQRQIFTYMPIIFTFMLGTFPSGLVIYWTWNNTLSVLQQSLIMKRAGVKNELWGNIQSLFGRKVPT